MLSKPKQKPSAPRLEDMVGIYGVEQGCDVVFLVGRDDNEAWRLPAHKAILQNATPVFRAMFSEHFVPRCPTSENHPHTIPVPDLDGRAFDNLLRHLYDESVTFQSVETALLTLFAAHKYQSTGLVQQCVNYLNKNLSVTNILYILSNVPLLCGNIQNLENRSRERQMNLVQVLPPPPASPRRNADAEDLDSIETECASLLQNCLEFVDKEAPAILQSDEMEDLDLYTIGLILKRDTLDISDENLVFSALLKWADKECKRQQLQLTPQSKRLVLGESLFLPRYLTMTPQSFQSPSGPAKSGLFTLDEISCITLVLKLIRQEMYKKPAIKSPSTTISPTVLLLSHTPSIEIPPEILHNFKPWMRIRTPVRLMGQSASIPGVNKMGKGKGLNLKERWKNRRFCCKKTSRWSHSNNSSQFTSPANSNPSSPIRLPPIIRGQSGGANRSKWNTAVERIVICFAWLID